MQLGSELLTQGGAACRYTFYLLNGDLALEFNCVHMAESALLPACAFRSPVHALIPLAHSMQCLYLPITHQPSPCQTCLSCALRPRCFHRPQACEGQLRLARCCGRLSVPAWPPVPLVLCKLGGPCCPSRRTQRCHETSRALPAPFWRSGLALPAPPRLALLAPLGALGRGLGRVRRGRRRQAVPDPGSQPRCGHSQGGTAPPLDR